jgi:hypothetical protein
MNSTEIANTALARVGKEDIMSLADADDENARIANRFFNSTVREVLRSHQWSSATKRQTLTKLTAAPDFGWTVQYLLPTDFVRAIYLNGDEVWDPIECWKIEGDRLLTDETTANMVYIFYDGVDTTNLDPLLAEAISLKLAYKMAPVLTGEPEMGSRMLAEYERALSAAKTSDSQETDSKENHPLDHILARSPIVKRRYISNLG